MLSLSTCTMACLFEIQSIIRQRYVGSSNASLKSNDWVSCSFQALPFPLSYLNTSGLAFRRLISYMRPPNTSLPSPATSPLTLARVVSSNSRNTLATRIFRIALSALPNASPTATLH